MKKTTRLASVTNNSTSSELHRHKIIKNDDMGVNIRVPRLMRPCSGFLLNNQFAVCVGGEVTQAYSCLASPEEECVTETALSGNEAAVGVSRRGGSSFSLHEKLFTAVTVLDSGVSFIITGN